MLRSEPRTPVTSLRWPLMVSALCVFGLRADGEPERCALQVACQGGVGLRAVSVVLPDVGEERLEVLGRRQDGGLALRLSVQPGKAALAIALAPSLRPAPAAGAAGGESRLVQRGAAWILESLGRELDVTATADDTAAATLEFPAPSAVLARNVSGALSRPLRPTVLVPVISVSRAHALLSLLGTEQRRAWMASPEAIRARVDAALAAGGPRPGAEERELDPGWTVVPRSAGFPEEQLVPRGVPELVLSAGDVTSWTVADTGAAVLLRTTGQQESLVRLLAACGMAATPDAGVDAGGQLLRVWWREPQELVLGTLEAGSSTEDASDLLRALQMFLPADGPLFEVVALADRSAGRSLLLLAHSQWAAVANVEILSGGRRLAAWDVSAPLPLQAGLAAAVRAAWVREVFRGCREGVSGEPPEAGYGLAAEAGAGLPPLEAGAWDLLLERGVPAVPSPARRWLGPALLVHPSPRLVRRGAAIVVEDHRVARRSLRAAVLALGEAWPWLGDVLDSSPEARTWAASELEVVRWRDDPTPPAALALCAMASGFAPERHQERMDRVLEAAGPQAVDAAMVVAALAGMAGPAWGANTEVTAWLLEGESRAGPPAGRQHVQDWLRMLRSDDVARARTVSAEGRLGRREAVCALFELHDAAARVTTQMPVLQVDRPWPAWVALVALRDLRNGVSPSPAWLRKALASSEPETAECLAVACSLLGEPPTEVRLWIEHALDSGAPPSRRVAGALCVLLLEGRRPGFVSGTLRDMAARVKRGLDPRAPTQWSGWLRRLP